MQKYILKEYMLREKNEYYTNKDTFEKINQHKLNMIPTPFFVVILLLLLSIKKTTATIPNNDGLLYKLYENNGLFGKPLITKIIHSPNLNVSDTTSFSAELTGTITFPTKETYYHFQCNFTKTTNAFLWIDGHQVCSDGNAYEVLPGSFDNPLLINERNLSLPFRLHIYYNPSSSSSKNIFSGKSLSNYVGFEMHCTKMSLNGMKSKDANIIFSPILPLAEKKRDQLQRSLANGWGSWLHHDILTVIKLPEAIAIKTTLCSSISNFCFDYAIPDGLWKKGTPPVRVGHHAIDRSYVQFYVGGTPNITANISIEYTVSADNNLQLLATPVDCGDDGENCSNFYVQIDPRFAWDRAGKVVSSTFHDATSITFTSPGFKSTIVYTLGQGDNNNNNNNKHVMKNTNNINIQLNKVGSPVGITTKQGDTIANVQAILKSARSKEEERLQRLYKDKANAMMGIQGSIMWTFIYVPSEIGPFMPVSRGWNFAPKIRTSDWSYAIFDWDNLFASLLAGSFDKNIAYSNLFQVIKTKTSAGFVPNFAAGGQSSEDRTEPPVGAKTVLSIYNKYKESWIIDVVYDDLLDWSNWFVKKRTIHGSPGQVVDGLISLGSFSDENVITNTTQAGNSMQDARYESGLDNSPMYDLPDNAFKNETTHLMGLADVVSRILFR